MQILTLSALISAASLAPDAWAAGVALPLSQVGTLVPEESLAQVVSPRKSDISAELDGILAAIEVLEGQKVSSGATLFTFDCRSHNLALQRADLAQQSAKEKVRQAKVVLDRSTEGLRLHSIPKAQNDVDRLAYKTALIAVSDAQLTWEEASVAVSKCSVIAPFAGVVTRIASGPGSYLTAGSLVLSMVATENLEVVAQLTPNEIDVLSAGADLRFISSDEDFPVSVRTIEPVFDHATGTQRVILMLPPAADLPVGLKGMLRWQGRRYSLPSDYLTRKGPEIGLLIEASGAEAFHPVPGAVEGLPVTVRLPADTKVFKP